MEEYPWPGNIRELRNRLERGVLLSGEGGVLRPQDLGLAAGEGELASLSTKEESDSLAAMEKQHIFRILESCGGNRTRAAEKLDISIRTLRNKLREYRIQSAEQSSDAPELKS